MMCARMRISIRKQQGHDRCKTALDDQSSMRHAGGDEGDLMAICKNFWD